MTFSNFCPRVTGQAWLRWAIAPLFLPLLPVGTRLAQAQTVNPRQIDEVIECEVLVVGGGLAGAATAYESLYAGRTVCLTELTDWVGGQLTSQGTSALDEAAQQRSQLFYSRGYLELRERIEAFYGERDPGNCWVSASCFRPDDANEILMDMLAEAEDEGDGTLHWFPATVVKDLVLSPDGRMIDAAIAIQHAPQPDTPPLNTEPLSEVYADIYDYQDSDRLAKTIIQFVPQPHGNLADGAAPKTDWYVVEATETGELIALADVPYRLGLDPRSVQNPSSPVTEPDPYCTQGFTYTFAMEQTAEPQPQPEPPFYPQYAPYYSYERELENGRYFDYVFTYRRIVSVDDPDAEIIFGVSAPKPGDISMQNWTWGNDYRPGTAADNLIYSHDQLVETGQLEPGGWQGGLRIDTLARGEENAIGFYHWLVAGTTDSQLGDGVAEVHPNNQFLSGFEAPMGTAHGLSKHPYIREGRRIIGRPSYAQPTGFTVNEIDISRADYSDPFYQETLSEREYRQLRISLASLESVADLTADTETSDIAYRSRSTIYPDAVGIAQYAIDFHPCMEFSPPEAPGNQERSGVRRAHGQAYPAQIPLRAMIPQTVDNLIVTGKSIATSTIAAAAYRVHSFEWSAGAATGTLVDAAFDENLLPYEFVDELPSLEPALIRLQQRLNAEGNPTAFPDTSIFNEDWSDWRVW